MAVKIADSLQSTITLHDGVEMPMFGMGLFRLGKGVGGQVETCVKHSLQHGYRLIDTSSFHGTEEDVGRAVKNSGIKREDIFIISKPWLDQHGKDKVKEAFHTSLRKMPSSLVDRLGLEYVDLYMIHSPMGGDNVETYKAILELQEQGLIRSVGVSNFNIQHLEGLREAGLPTPSVDQVELNPWMRRKNTVDYCRKAGIAVMGYSPIAKGQHLDDQVIVDMAKKYNKNVGQVTIRWSVQSGFIAIPKSANLDRIVENSQVFDWALDEGDMTTMNNFPEQSCMKRAGWTPMESEWTG